MFKKVFLTIGVALSFVFQMANAQDDPGAKLEQIDTFVADSTVYGILTDSDVKNSEIYLTMQVSNDNFALSRFKQYKLKEFIRTLEKAKGVYAKWMDNAKSSSVKQFSKRIEKVMFADQYIFFMADGNWYHEKGVNVWAKFYVDGNGDCFLIIETDKMSTDEVVSKTLSGGWSNSLLGGNMHYGSSKSKTEVQRNSAGASIVFASVEEIDECISKLQKAIEWKKEREKMQKMFR